ncbi:MAG: RDD family protein [Thermomicrobiales bacterium]
MYCTQCGAVLSPGTSFCGNCGWQVAPKATWQDEVRDREARGLKLCVHCRSEIPLEATICRRCEKPQPAYDPALWSPAPPDPSPTPQPQTPVYGIPAPPLPTPVSSSIDADFQLASVGRRIGAYAIDIVVLVFIAVLVIFALGIDPEDSSTQNQQLGIYAVITLVYFTISEALTSQTVGKRLTGIKVVTLEGQPISWGTSARRNLMRIVDSLPALYIVGLIVMSRNDRLQRLGDKVAGTVVIMSK